MRETMNNMLNIIQKMVNGHKFKRERYSLGQEYKELKWASWEKWFQFRMKLSEGKDVITSLDPR